MGSCQEIRLSESTAGAFLDPKAKHLLFVMSSSLLLLLLCCMRHFCAFCVNTVRYGSIDASDLCDLHAGLWVSLVPLPSAVLCVFVLTKQGLLT